MEHSKKQPLGESATASSQTQCICEELCEDDLPCATLPGRPEDCKKVQLQDWLKCRGLAFKTSSTKSVLVSSVRQFMSSGITFTFTDPDPNRSHIRKKKALCETCSSVNASKLTNVTGSKQSQTVPSEGWTESTGSLPKTFTIVSLVEFMQKSGKTVKDPVTKENKENSKGVFSQTSMEKGYKFFFDNYLHNIECAYESEMCFVRASCYHSQKKHSLAHKLLVRIDPSGNVKNGKCSCVAGESGICNHILGTHMTGKISLRTWLCVTIL